MKPFLVVEITDGILGLIYERPTWDEAVDCAIEIIIAQIPDIDSNQVRAELEADTNWYSPLGDITVNISQTE